MFNVRYNLPMPAGSCQACKTPGKPDTLLGFDLGSYEARLCTRCFAQLVAEGTGVIATRYSATAVASLSKSAPANKNNKT